MKTQTHNEATASVSERIPDTEFPFRVFYYSPGMGFDTGNLVYVGRSEWRTKEQADKAAKEWERSHLESKALLSHLTSISGVDKRNE